MGETLPFKPKGRKLSHIRHVRTLVAKTIRDVENSTIALEKKAVILNQLAKTLGQLINDVTTTERLDKMQKQLDAGEKLKIA